LPSLVRWQQEIGSDRLSVLAVFSYSAGEPEMVEELLARKKVTFPVLSDGSANMKRHGVKGFPSAFFLDSTGKVIWQGILPRGNHDNDWRRQWLDKLLLQAGVTPPPVPIRWLDLKKGTEVANWTSQTRLILVEAQRCSQTQEVLDLLDDEEIADLTEEYIRIKIDGRKQLEMVKKYGGTWAGDLLVVDFKDRVLYRYRENRKDIVGLKRALRQHRND